MTVVVTGAAGLVGVNLLRSLLAEGRSVRAILYEEHEKTRLEGLAVEVVRADVTRPETLLAAFQGAEVVYHLAGLIALHPRDTQWAEKININGVQNVVEACLKTGVRRLVHFSSFHALQQKPFSQPLTEDSPLVPPNYKLLYCRTKAQGERIIAEGVKKGLNAVIVRPTGIIGVNDHQPSLFGRTLIQLAQGKMPALVNGGCNWVDVRDVAGGAIAAEKHAPAGAKYLLGGRYAHLKELAGLVANITKVPPPRLVMPMWSAELAAGLAGLPAYFSKQPVRFTAAALDALQPNPDIRHDRARQELGYQPRPLEQTLVDTLGWFKEQGYL